MIPCPKSVERKSGNLILSKLTLFGESKVCNFAKTYLNQFLQQEVEILMQNNANIVFIYAENLKQGGYHLIVDDKCVISYSDFEGVRNALSTLIQIAKSVDGALSIPCQVINDYPDANFRSVMIDLARGLPDINRLKQDLKMLSLAKCNKIHLHLMDSDGLCYQSNVITINSSIRGTNRYTKEEMRDIADYCSLLGLEIIPEIEFPAHASLVTKNYPQLLCQTNLPNQSGWTVCIGNENVYTVFENLVNEVCGLIPSTYFHIGGDEHKFPDLPKFNLYCHWNSCKVCRKKMQKEGLLNETELFYYSVRRMNEIVKKQGRKLILWNDELDVSKPINIPKDCIVQFWRVANKNRGPREGCSYSKFLQQGFNVICSPFEYCYIDLEEYANPEKTASFNYKKYDESQNLTGNVLGVETCAWEYGNPEYSHYLYSFIPSAVLLLCKAWDRNDVIYNKTYRLFLTKLIFGVETPIDYDVFELFGSIMPPRINAKPSYVSLQNELIDEKVLQRHQSVLTNMRFTYNERYKKQILNLITELSN